MGKFLVRLINEFSAITGAASRTRAGITVPVGGEGVVADLDKDQLQEIHEDQYLSVHDAKTGELITPKGSEGAPAISTEAEEARRVEEAAAAQAKADKETADAGKSEAEKEREEQAAEETAAKKAEGDKVAAEQAAAEKAKAKKPSKPSDAPKTDVPVTKA